MEFLTSQCCICPRANPGLTGGGATHSLLNNSVVQPELPFPWEHLRQTQICTEYSRTTPASSLEAIPWVHCTEQSIPNTARASRVRLLGDWTALVNLPGMRFVGDVSATQLRGAVSVAFVNGRDGCGGGHTNNITLGTRHSDMSTVQGFVGCPDIHFITITFPTTEHLNEMVGDCPFGCWSRCADAQRMSGIKVGV